MPLRNTSERYGAVHMAVHWLTALLIVGMIAGGLIMVRLDPFQGSFAGLSTFQIYQLHKSLGLTLLAVTIVRLGWRLANPVPAIPDTLTRTERVLANGTHIGLYVLLFAMPITGWLMTSASTLGIPTSYFGLFTVPHLIGQSEEVEAVLKIVHEYLAYTLAALVTLHVAGALKHHFVLKDRVLARMLPGAGQRPAPGGRPA